MAGLNCPTGRQSTLKLLLWKINKERIIYFLCILKEKISKIISQQENFIIMDLHLDKTLTLGWSSQEICSMEVERRWEN